MKHLRYLRDWPVMDGEPVSERELMDRWDMVLRGEHPAGGWIVDCLGRGCHEGQLSDDLPGVRLTAGRGPLRYRRAPEDVLGVAYHQRVIRGRGDHDVRRAAGVHAEREPGPPTWSPEGRGSQPHLEHAEPDARTLIRGAEVEVEAGRAGRRDVCACEVEDSDVVVTGPRAHRWAGEP